MRFVISPANIARVPAAAVGTVDAVAKAEAPVIAALLAQRTRGERVMDGLRNVIGTGPAVDLAAEGALLRNIESARLAGTPLFGERGPEDAARAHELLRHGRTVHSELIAGGNRNHFLDLEQIHHAGRTSQAVVKEGADSRWEAFASGLAQRLRFDRMVPGAAYSDGAVRMEYRPGTPALDCNVRSSRQLTQYLATGYEQRLGPGHELVARRLAFLDAQAMRAFDYVLANSDRHGRNVLLHDDHTATWIDHGFAGRGELTPRSLRPLASSFSLWSGRMKERLDPQVVEHFRQHLDADAIVREARLLAPSERKAIPGMAARLEHMLRTGEIQWVRGL